MTTKKPVDLPALCTVDQWRSVVSMSKAAVYRAIEAGRLVAVRVSPRLTLIDVDASLAVLRALPPTSRGAPPTRLAA